jgi:hypothetical protein
MQECVCRHYNALLQGTQQKWRWNPMEWALDRIGPAGQQLPSEDLLRAAGVDTVIRRSRKKSSPPRAHAIRLNEVIIHNNRTWFGEGDIRLDALVVHGN